MNRRVSSRQITVLLLGFASGLPLLLTYSTLQSWYTEVGVDIVTIGFLGLVGLPYSFKFIWAPCFDRFFPPFLTRRRGWIIITQCLLILGIAVMAFVDPAATPMRMGLLALGVALCSATQDVGVDAYRTDLLQPHERALGVALFMVAYRIAMILAGGIALILADNIGWRHTYLLMAGLMAVGVVTTLLSSEPMTANRPPKTLKEAIVQPCAEFFQRRYMGWILLFILLYKLGDAFVMSMAPTFLLRELQFSLTEVGTVTKIIGLLATFCGVFIASALVQRIGLLRSLFLFGLCQGCSNLALMMLAFVGKHYALMVVTVSLENLCAGMEGAGIVIFITGLCNVNYTAAQYAFLSAIATMGRVFMGPIAGYMQSWFGWANFFFLGFLVTIPPLLILLKMKPTFQHAVMDAQCNVQTS